MSTMTLETVSSMYRYRTLLSLNSLAHISPKTNQTREILKLITVSKLHTQNLLSWPNFLQNSKIHLITYWCQNWNLIMVQFEKLDVTYRNLLRRMKRGGFKRIGDFQYKLNNEKVYAICCTWDVSNYIWKQQKDYAGHIFRMLTERCQKQLMFTDDKHRRIGRVTPSLLEQMLKFNNSTIDNFINNSMKRWLKNSTLSLI